MAKDWYYQVMGQKFGPVTYADIVRLARQGSLQPETLLRKGVAGNWTPADQVKGIFGGAAAPAGPAASVTAAAAAATGGAAAPAAGPAGKEAGSVKGVGSGTREVAGAAAKDKGTESPKGAGRSAGAGVAGEAGRAAAEAAEAAIELESSVRPCPECGKTISKKVGRCPHCGTAVEHEGETAAERRSRVLARRTRVLRRYWPVLASLAVVALAVAAGTYYYVNRPVVLSYDEKTLEEWEAQLGSGDRDLRLEAMVAIGHLAVQAPQLVSQITEIALLDKDLRMRMQALATVARTADEASDALNETRSISEERFNAVIGAIREQVPAVRKETLAAAEKHANLAQRIAAFQQGEKKTNPPPELLAEQRQWSEYFMALQRFPLNDWAQYDPARAKKAKKKPEKKVAKPAEKPEEKKEDEKKDEKKQKADTKAEKKNGVKDEQGQEKKDERES